MSRDTRGESTSVDISVIVSTYRQPELLSCLLRSLSRQDFTGPFEVIVCDDGSDTATLASLSSVVDRNALDVKYVWQPDGEFRLARSRNNGIRLAQGALLVFIDGDMLPGTTWLSSHAAAASATSAPALIACASRNVAVEPASFAALTVDDALAKCRSVDESSPQQREFGEWQRGLIFGLLPWMGCCGGHFSVSRSAEVLYDENFVGFGHEDQELFCRLYHQHGFSFHWQPQVETFHLVSGTVAGPWSPWRESGAGAIEAHVRNCLYMRDKFPNIALGPAMWPLQHFIFDQAKNEWRRASSSELLELPVAISQAEHWLKSRGR